jgi:putative metalloprotease
MTMLAVIGHEIGHVANHDSRDAIKAAWKRLWMQWLQSNKVAAITDSQLAKTASVVIDNKHSRSKSQKRMSSL